MMSARFTDCMVIGFCSLVFLVAYLIKPTEYLDAHAEKIETSSNLQIQYHHPLSSEEDNPYVTVKDELIRNLTSSLELERLRNTALEEELESAQYLFEQIFIASRAKLLAAETKIGKAPYIKVLLGELAEKPEPERALDATATQTTVRPLKPVALPVARPAQASIKPAVSNGRGGGRTQTASINGRGEADTPTRAIETKDNVKRAAVIEGRDNEFSETVRKLLAPFNYKMTERGLLVMIPGKKLFAGNSREIVPDAHDFLRPIATVVEQDASLTIEIAGHTDALRSMEESRAISQRRASTVKGFLIDKLNVDGQRINAVGKGKRYPIDSNATLDGRQANRRIEILFEKE